MADSSSQDPSRSPAPPKVAGSTPQGPEERLADETPPYGVPAITTTARIMRTDVAAAQAAGGPPTATAPAPVAPPAPAASPAAYATPPNPMLSAVAGLGAPGAGPGPVAPHNPRPSRRRARAGWSGASSGPTLLPPEDLPIPSGLQENTSELIEAAVHRPSEGELLKERYRTLGEASTSSSLSEIFDSLSGHSGANSGLSPSSTGTMRRITDKFARAESTQPPWATEGLSRAVAASLEESTDEYAEQPPAPRITAPVPQSTVAAVLAELERRDTRAPTPLLGNLTVQPEDMGDVTMVITRPGGTPISVEAASPQGLEPPEPDPFDAPSDAPPFDDVFEDPFAADEGTSADDGFGAYSDSPYFESSPGDSFGDEGLVEEAHQPAGFLQRFRLPLMIGGIVALVAAAGSAGYFLLGGPDESATAQESVDGALAAKSPDAGLDDAALGDATAKAEAKPPEPPKPPAVLVDLHKPTPEPQLADYVSFVPLPLSGFKVEDLEIKSDPVGRLASIKFPKRLNKAQKTRIETVLKQIPVVRQAHWDGGGNTLMLHMPKSGLVAEKVKKPDGSTIVVLGEIFSPAFLPQFLLQERCMDALPVDMTPTTREAFQAMCQGNEVNLAILHESNLNYDENYLVGLYRHDELRRWPPKTEIFAAYVNDANLKPSYRAAGLITLGLMHAAHGDPLSALEALIEAESYAMTEGTHVRTGQREVIEHLGRASLMALMDTYIGTDAVPPAKAIAMLERYSHWDGPGLVHDVRLKIARLYRDMLMPERATNHYVLIVKDRPANTPELLEELTMAYMEADMGYQAYATSRFLREQYPRFTMSDRVGRLARSGDSPPPPPGTPATATR